MVRVLIAMISLSISACATIESNYTPVSKIPQNSGITLHDTATFSVELVSEIGSFSAIDKEDLVSEINNKLHDSGPYHRVNYKPISRKSDYHLHFQLVVSGTKENEAMGLGYLSGLTLTLIPVYLDYYSDMSVFLIEGSDETFSAAASEKIHQALWLPLLVLAPYFNDYLTAGRVINNQTNYLISELPKSVP